MQTLEASLNVKIVGFQFRTIDIVFMIKMMLYFDKVLCFIL